MILEAMCLDLFRNHEEEIDKIELKRKISKVSIIISNQRFILKMDASQQQKVPLTVRWKDMQKSSELRERS